jgi:hypothetical protein
MASRPRNNRRLLRGAILVALAAVTAQTTLHLVDVLVLHGRFESFDAGSDRGLGAAATIVAGLAAALSALVLSLRSPNRTEANLLRFLAVGLGFLAIDRVAALHDRLAYELASLVGLPDVAAWPTPIVYGPLLLPAAYILWRRVRRSVQTTARAGIILLGLALALLPLALGAKLFFGGVPRGIPRDLAIATKQGLELGGWVLIAAALLWAATANGLPEKRPRAPVTIELNSKTY